MDLGWQAAQVALLLTNNVTRPVFAWLVTGVLLCAASAQSQQNPEASNSLEGNPRAIASGKSTFREGCAQCHGLNAEGGLRAPSLVSGRFSHGGSDANLFATILHGIPGTLMPANDLSDDETWEVIAFLHSIQPRSSAVSAGNASVGEHYFSTYGHCSSCHMVRGKGGGLGPDLSRVGAARSIDYMVESIREPNRQISDGMLEPGHDFPIAYDTVTVTLEDGRTIVGVARNEDTFSIQMIDLSGELRLLPKTDANSVVHERRSLMPAYGNDSLSEQSLQDLLAYLETLRGQ